MSELGTTTLGQTLLGQAVTVIETGTAASLDDSNGQLQSLTPTSESRVDTNTLTPTITGLTVKPVILNATNINIRYDREREVFVSSWIPTFTFDDARDQLIAAVSTTEDANNISVVIERDIDGDNNAELYTDEYIIDSDIEFVRADPQGEEGRYRLVFPRYNQDDVVETINIALTYDNTQRIIDNIPYSFISADADGDTDLDQWVAAFGTALDRFDILLDTVYDNQFVESARGGGLDDLGAALGIERRDINNPERADDLETDARLRKRIAVARTLVGQTTTAPSFTQVLSVLYPRAIGSINIDIKDEIPVAEVKIPQEAFQRNPLDKETTVDILNKAVASSYNIELTILGSFRFEGSAPGEGWNEGTWSRSLDFDNDANSSLYEPASEY